MAYGLVVLDLDGTLLQGSLSLDPVLVTACRGAMARGLIITLATGRMPPAARPYWEEMGITAPVILYNGALIRDPVGARDLFAVTLPTSLPWAVFPIFANAPVHPLFYQNDRLYCLKRTSPIMAYCREQGVTAEPTSEPESFLKSGVFVKCLFIGRSTDLAVIREGFALLVGDQARLVISRPGHLELLPATASKGAALRFLAAHLRLPLARIIAVGDQENDLEMIRDAGMGVAMAHAPDDVKAAANRVAPPPEHGGLLALLAELCPGYFDDGTAGER
jgi:hypothetical protein